jgi:predicted glycosyltransferase
VQVSLKPMKLEDILKECIVFIGAGGSMTRELAFLGVPTLSVYQGDLLSVDKHLINCGIMRHTHSPKIEDIENLIKKQYLKNNITLFEKGTEAFELIDKKIKELGATKKK